MLLDPMGKVLFMEICKRLRDNKWTVDDHQFYKDEDVTEAVFALPEYLVEREDNPEFEKDIAVVKYEGDPQKMKENQIDGVLLKFYTKRLKALGLYEAISDIELFQRKNNATSVEFYVDQVFADEKVQEWFEALFHLLDEQMTGIYGDEIKEIPIVLLPKKLHDLPLHTT
ncbi:hypothetical protein [Jeotgalibacillus haloalkalitolerans]|uniref:Uncharacterized protein n=1 Tax=Jeotgalibacillus haloalkalitolerans TaxID=3104292 RepID=A0ABU5KK26_9BACL|nr:hypothetical protein [Jeotgalibacillus sp. HH7-29]MDZ5711281.1 hypothetical protein [Jeotgalibacillus sp. HH7-29]